MLMSLSRREAVAAGLSALALCGARVALADSGDAAGAKSDSTDAQGASGSAGQLAEYASKLSAVPCDLTEDQLDDAVAVYTYDGAAVEVTARMVIDDATNLQQRLNDDGTYSAPTADDILTYVRNQILRQLVSANGVEVSDDEAIEYMQTTLGVSDYATLASYYGLDEDKAKIIVVEGAEVAKLRDTVTGSVGSAPETPTAPADGDNTKASADYASYIIDLVGDDWNAETKTWADGSVYGEALSAYDFNGETANYEMAFAAYSVAAQKYSQSSSEQYSAWQTYTNGYFCTATLTLLTLKG